MRTKLIASFLLFFSCNIFASDVAVEDVFGIPWRAKQEYVFKALQRPLVTVQVTEFEHFGASGFIFIEDSGFGVSYKSIYIYLKRDDAGYLRLLTYLPTNSSRLKVVFNESELAVFSRRNVKLLSIPKEAFNL